MNTVKEIQRLNKRELENSISTDASWHTDYRDTAYVYVGGLSFDLTEGDIVTIFSQFGEPVWVKLVRDKETGKSKGFAFLKFEDQRSSDLAVDNLGGATILGRVLRVDHTRYKKRDDEDDEQFNVAITGRGTAASMVPERQQDDLNSPNAEMRRGRAPDDAMVAEHDEEDPMKEYIKLERRERHRTHRDRGERHSREHHQRHHRRHKHRSLER